MLSWFYRSQMSQTKTTSNNRTTKMLPRFYRSKMSYFASNNSTNNIHLINNTFFLSMFNRIPSY